MYPPVMGVRVLGFLLLISGASCGPSPAASNASDVEGSQCRSDRECEEASAGQCPGGSAPLARCEQGTCRFDACTSPIGTPCDDDPATQFEGEECP